MSHAFITALVTYLYRYRIRLHCVRFPQNAVKSKTKHLFIILRP